MLWLLAVTMTAGVEKIVSSDPSVGFLAQAALPSQSAIEVFNARLDAVVAAVFLVLVAIVVVSAARQWFKILRGRVPIESDGPTGGGVLGHVLGEVPAINGRTRGCC